MDLTNTSVNLEIVTAKVSFSTSGAFPREPRFFIRDDHYNDFLADVKRFKEKGYKQITAPAFMVFNNDTYLATTFIKPDNK